MSKDIKKIIKPLVRECLLELFLEMKLENIVENVVRQQQKDNNQESSRILVSEAKEIPVIQKNKPNKHSLMEAIGVNENTWNDVYADTLKHGNSILNNKDTTTTVAPNYDDTELVNESVLKQAGLMKDYSRFVK